VFALTAAAYVWSGFFVFGLRPDKPPETAGDEALLPQLLAGFRAIGADRRLQVVIGLVGGQMFVLGALEVVIVVDAIRVLHAGNAGVGWLNTGLGVGGLLAGLLGVALAARKRLAGDFRLGLVAVGAALAILAATANLTVALLLFGVIGAGSTLVDVTGMTLLQRAAPAEVVGRVFGVLQSTMLAMVALGSLVTPLLISAVGARVTFVVMGLILPLAVVPTWRRLTEIDVTARVATEPLELLRAIPIFAPLPAPVLERLASLAADVRAAAGSAVFEQGAAGDRFYVIAEGRAAVEIDGTQTSTLDPGGFFGEIALLRDIPRTATVRALEGLRLYALDRDDFIAAVTGHAPSREAADSLVASRFQAVAAI
jgi:hypothetical protein